MEATPAFWDVLTTHLGHAAGPGAGTLGREPTLAPFRATFDPGLRFLLLGGGLGSRVPAQFTARRAAGRDVAALRAERAALRREFLARSGWTLLIEAERPPLYPEGFDPLNVRTLSDSEVLHTRWLRLSGPAGTVEVMGRAVLTRAAGAHPLFEGVRSLVIAGLPSQPAVQAAEGRVALQAEGVRASIARAVVERDDRSRTLRVRAP